jgi:hypothetical protein
MVKYSPLTRISISRAADKMKIAICISLSQFLYLLKIDLFSVKIEKILFSIKNPPAKLKPKRVKNNPIPIGDWIKSTVTSVIELM